MTPSRGTRASYSVHDGQVSGDPAPAVAWYLISACHREPYRIARLIIAVSGRYLAAGQKRIRYRRAERSMMYGDSPPDMLKYLPFRGCPRLLQTVLSHDVDCGQEWQERNEIGLSRPQLPYDSRYGSSGSAISGAD